MRRSFGFLACGAMVLGGAALIPASAAAADGAAVYAAHCKSCHGADGAGNPAIAKMMSVTMKPLDSPEVQAKSDADLKTVVTAGTGKMKPVTGLAAADLDNLVAWLHTLKK